jgi:predicted GNAT superfamily acetyltransferase
MIEFRNIDVWDVMEQQGILADHWEEVALNKRLMKLEPRWSTYFQMELAGTLFVIGAYEANKLIGYSANIIQPHLHYAGLMVCMNDLLFVLPEYRDKPVGLRLMAQTRVVAKHKGAELMLWHAKPATALAAIMARSKKARVQDIIYSEEL